MTEESTTQTHDPINKSVIDARPRKIQSRTFGSQTWYFLRRWPLIPLVIMTILLVTGLFAPVVSPADPIEQSLGFRNFPPTWGKAMPEYNVVPDPADYDLETTKGKSAYNRAKKNSFTRSKYILGADNLGRDVLSRIVLSLIHI